MEKTGIRKIMLEKLRNQTKEERRRKSLIIKEKLFSLEEFKRSKNLMSYINLDYEVDTENIIKEALRMGKVVAVPVTVKKDKTILPSKILNFEEELVPANFGIREPKKEFVRIIPKESLELVLVPGIAFDKKGKRIGHGAGYYDRFLSTLPEHTVTIGLAFDFQIVDNLPLLPHDVPVSKVLSA
ncbi:MAG: 5-formyltetrahydrofolate cyclo-ligase [Candidatus Omnitrophica bacterium]|nr:5-formyltetrahydrofolate cyclo-ligase [Candidatus Omnitrophota bacterium]